MFKLPSSTSVAPTILDLRLAEVLAHLSSEACPCVQPPTLLLLRLVVVVNLVAVAMMPVTMVLALAVSVFVPPWETTMLFLFL